MKDHTFSGQLFLSVIVFSQEFKSACDASEIHDNTALWLSKQYPIGPAGAVVTEQVTLPWFANFSCHVALRSSSDIVQFLLKRYVTDNDGRRSA